MDGYLLSICVNSLSVALFVEDVDGLTDLVLLMKVILMTIQEHVCAEDAIVSTMPIVRENNIVKTVVV